MYEPEDPTNPYDNVEFPVRKPGTGTWSPGTSSGSGAGSGSKLLGGHQTAGRAILAGPKLAPLVEVDGAETPETQRLLPASSSTGTNKTSSSSSSSSFSSPSSPTSAGPVGSQKHVVQNKSFTTNTLPSSQKTTPAPNPIPLSSGVNAATANSSKSVSSFGSNFKPMKKRIKKNEQVKRERGRGEILWYHCYLWRLR